MICDVCYKGYINSYTNIIMCGRRQWDSRERDWKCIDTELQHYKFCSNVMCDWNLIKYEHYYTIPDDLGVLISYGTVGYTRPIPLRYQRNMGDEPLFYTYIKQGMERYN